MRTLLNFYTLTHGKQAEMHVVDVQITSLSQAVPAIIHLFLQRFSTSKSLSLLPSCRRGDYFMYPPVFGETSLGQLPSLKSISKAPWLLSLHASSCSGLRFSALTQGLHIPVACFFFFFPTNLRVSANLEAPNDILRRPAA